ncbi:MAG: GMC oxidoreductase [Bacteroidota bacterium]
MEKYGDEVEISVIEIGNRKIKSEREIGLDSISENSTVASAGRYFGFGGTSARWGGQVLFFDERDNPKNDQTWNKIVEINNQYKGVVLKNLLAENSEIDLAENNRNIKTGIWLKYIKRNTYKRLNKKELNKVKFLADLRVVNFKFENKKIYKIICKNKSGELKEINADIFYLTAGALESCRLLLQLNQDHHILIDSDLGNNFGDHISTELFHVKNTAPIIDKIDFTPRLFKGSLVTQRMIVKTDKGVIGFLHGVFNKDIKAFKFLKEILFGKKETTVSFAEFISGFIFLFKFGFHLLFKNKLYVDKNQWSLQLDMEQPVPNKNKLILSEKKDQFGESVLKIEWEVSENDLNAIEEVRKKVEELLKENNLEYTPLYNPASTNNKVEDVYHPVGFLRIGDDEKAVVDFDCRVKGIQNLYHFSTGIFPSAKSINPSAAVMCFIEKHVEHSA